MKLTKTNFVYFAKQHKYTMFVFFLFLVSAYFLRQNVDKGSLFNLLLAIYNALFLIGVLNIVSKTKQLIIPFCLILAFVVAVDITHYLVFDTRISFGTIASIFETNVVEASAVSILFLPLGVMLWVLLSVLLYRSCTELKNSKLNVITSLSLLIFSFILINIALLVYMGKDKRERAYKEILISPLLYTESITTEKLPLGLATSVTTVSYFWEMHRFRKEQAKEKKLPDYITYDSSSKTPDKIFVLIGESSCRDYYGLYGYPINTTPFLDSMQQVSSMYYYDAISPSSITRDALKLSLSFASPLNEQPFYENKNVISLANDAGYESIWISNQNNVGMQDSYVGLIASYANKQIFFDYKKDDLDLITSIKSLYKSQTKQIFFVHLRGSHYNYKDKFDAEDTKALGEVRETIDYEKSIHHTDRVVHQFYDFAKSDSESSSIVCFYSDHGEIVNKGHGFQDMDNKQFRVPMVLLSNNYNASGVDSLIVKYSNKNRFNTTNLSYVFSYLFGYSISENITETIQREGLFILQPNGKWELYK